MTKVFNNAEYYDLKTIVEPFPKKDFVFYQRVYSSSQGWCYYSTIGKTVANPDSNLTLPPHQDDIVKHELIAESVTFE
jgi:hypothetical protein